MIAYSQKRFEESIVHFDRSLGYMPEYCGIYRTDKAIVSAVEGCTKEEQAFVYNIIRQNFLLDNSSSLLWLSSLIFCLEP